MRRKFWAAVFLGPGLLLSGWHTDSMAAMSHSAASHSPIVLQGNLSSVSNASFLIDMYMVNARTGFVSGYWHNRFSVWKTADGGLCWDRQAVPYVPRYNPISGDVPPVFYDLNGTDWIAWIAKDHQVNRLTVLRSADGGRRWTYHAQTVIPVANSVKQISFWSGENGWIRAFSGGVMNQGDTSIYYTGNGGGSWALVSSGAGYVPNTHATSQALPEFDVPMPMVFTSARDGWVAIGDVVQTQTSLAVLYHTTTAGKKWFPVRLSVPNPYRHGFATMEYQPVFSQNTGTVLVQYLGNNLSFVVGYQTTDGGKTWAAGTPVSFGKQDNTVVQSFINPRIGWVIGNSGSAFERTQNGGRSWSAIRITGFLATLLRNGYSIKRLDMVTPKMGWMMVENENGMTSGVITRILRTTDGGRIWR